MNQNDTTAIIERKFPSVGEKLAYCPHCLKPFKPSYEGEYTEDIFDDYLGPDTSASLRELAAGLLLGGPDQPGLAIILLGDQHVCGETCPGGAEAKHAVPEENTFPWEMLDSDGQNIIFCPECHSRIHRWEGPMNAKGYRAELVRRLLEEKPGDDRGFPASPGADRLT